MIDPTPASRCVLALAIAATLPLAALRAQDEKPPVQVGGDPTPAVETPQDPVPQVDVGALRRAAAKAESEGRHAEAAKLYLELRAAEPGIPKWAIYAADNLGRAGEANDALDLLDEARSAFPDSPEVATMLAKTFHLKADQMRAGGNFDSHVVFLYEDTRRTAEKVLEMDPGNVEARLLVASASFQLGDSERALTEARKVTESAPAEYGGHAMVGRVLFQRFVDARQADDQELANTAQEGAENALQAATKADPTRTFPLVKLGDLDAWNSKMDAALEHYRAALALDPNSQVQHSWLRTAIDAPGRLAFYKGAREAYGKRDGATPAGSELLRWYEAQAHFDARDWKAAAAGFAQTLEALPDYIDTYWWLMQAHYWGGDPDAARKVSIEFARKNPRRFADMIREDDATVSAVVGMAAAAYGSGDVAGSRDLNQVIAYARQTTDAWNNYAFLCRETRRFDESARAYEEALNIEPDDPQLLNDCAVIYQYNLRSEENLAKARDYYDRAIKVAEQRLAKGDLKGAELDRTRTALRDARNNLRAMR